MLCGRRVLFGLSGAGGNRCREKKTLVFFEVRVCRVGMENEERMSGQRTGKKSPPSLTHFASREIIF